MEELNKRVEARLDKIDGKIDLIVALLVGIAGGLVFVAIMPVLLHSLT